MFPTADSSSGRGPDKAPSVLNAAPHSPAAAVGRLSFDFVEESGGGNAGGPGSSTGAAGALAASMPPLGVQGSPAAARPMGAGRARPQPAPPSMPPPDSLLRKEKNGEAVPERLISFRLPEISPRSEKAGPAAPQAPVLADPVSPASRQCLEDAKKAEAQASQAARERIHELSKRATHGESMMEAMREAQQYVVMCQGEERTLEAGELEESDADKARANIEMARNKEKEARARADRRVKIITPECEEQAEIFRVLADTEGPMRARLEAEAQVQVEEETARQAELEARGQARARQAAAARLAAEKVAAQLAEEEVGGGEGAGREEIVRAMAAVNEAKRKRVEAEAKRKLGDGEAPEQAVDKSRRRQNKKEELMKKRKDMEARLKEEASKMAQLTESAKKKGESKLQTEEAKREAEERMKAEADAVAELERQAAELAAHRAEMEKQLAQKEQEKQAQIEATSSALEAKRAEVEAKMRQEEEELRRMTEDAKRQVEDKMAAEANAIAEMERKAAEMALKRSQLEKQMTEDSALEKQSHKLAQKRADMEVKMQMEEEEIKKLSEDAKRRVGDKMAEEAAAIAAMEKQAADLVRKRAEMAEAVASQQAEVEQWVSSEGEPQTQAYSYHQGGQYADVGGGGGAGGADDGSGYSYAGGEQSPGGAEPQQRMRLAHSSKSLYDLLARDRSGEDSAYTRNSIAEVAGEEDDGEWEGGEGEGGGPGAGAGEGGGVYDNAGAVAFEGICQECLANQGELPAAHFAAASGHVACLEAIRANRPDLLSSLCPANRPPLFYACANSHVEATEMLVSACPQTCPAVDVNHDSPLHAAALSGSSACVQLLLEGGQANMEHPNGMGMTPAHLAASREVLEVLSQYGADLNAKDMDLRTPLFIACATDRVEKAEFLCELLDCEGQDLGTLDKRGDTPLHAAACNGSTACLLLLLQYGMQPDVRNRKGLRPIDLAARRGHSACESILMEYHLHHSVDNAVFDTVLFIATLEGHKKCKEVLQDSSTRDNSPYEIIKPASPSSKSKPSLERAESLWSLRRGRSVRLQQYGDWIAYEDQNTSGLFWYNHVTQVTQWEQPDGLHGQGGGKQAGSGGPTDFKKLANASMRLKRDGDWIQYTIPDGNVFYYNDKTNNFQWERPEELGPPEGDDGVGGVGAAGGAQDDDWSGSENAASPWSTYKDPSSGLVFWYNEETGESQWEPPEGVQEDFEGGGGGQAAEEESNVREVTEVDDLFTPR